MVKGNVDRVTEKLVSGWAYDPKTPGSLEVRAMLGRTPIGSAVAIEPRPDVAAALGTTGLHGFTIHLTRPLTKDEQASLTVEAKKEPLNGVKYAIADKPGKSYQSFDDVKGASKSADKLRRLQLSQLPNRSSDQANPLKGLSVLDIGCNEGFFAGEALRQGATRVLGIDSANGFIERARKRFPHGEFVTGSWWDVPNEKFDVIFFLSAIHYEDRQRELLEMLATRLTPTGVLVLECGVGPGDFAVGGEKKWHAVKRWDGVRRYPSYGLLTSDLLHSYAERWMGGSVLQEGDPIPRQVFHCSLRQPTVILLSGPTKSGKTALLSQFAGLGATTFQIDWLLTNAIREDSYAWSALATGLRQFRGSPIQLHIVSKFIVDNGLVDAFTELLLLEAPTDCDLTIIEGEILNHPAVHQAVTKGLREKHIKCWSAALSS